MGTSHRRALLMALAVAATMLAGGATARAEDSAVEFVRRVSRDLISANHSGSIPSFSAALNAHAHVQAIGTYALGSYRSNLKPAERESYINGMVRFISRYAASESQKYQVVRLDILGPASRTSSGVVVESRVVLKDGQTYDVEWLLQPVGGGYRIRDAKVAVMLADYWMTPFLKDLFEKYIADNGSVQALVLALNK